MSVLGDLGDSIISVDWDGVRDVGSFLMMMKTAHDTLVSVSSVFVLSDEMIVIAHIN